MITKIKQLIKELNQASNKYYNGIESGMTDKEWDKKFDELKKLEDETRIILSNSPTQKVGYEVIEGLEKIVHKYPMKSLAKTKEISEVKKFMGKHDCILSLKLDGISNKLIYENGELVIAATRGNGEIGSIITHNAKTYTNIPFKIPYLGRVEIIGEAIITGDVFEELNKNDEYKNARNLVAGSVMSLNSKDVKDRKIKFIAYGVNKEGVKDETKLDQLRWLENKGFEIVDFYSIYHKDDIETNVESLKEKAAKKYIPIDGLVITYNDLEYAEKLGSTSHHPLHSIALKGIDEQAETILRNIEFQVGRTGVLTPVANFDTVELEGTEVSKATLHNLSILKGLELGIGDSIIVQKQNMIIPAVVENLTRSNTVVIPKNCPECGGEAIIKTTENAEFLHCNNLNCSAKLVQKIKHYCSKNAMNIEGLSEKTIEKFIEKGFIKQVGDIYRLENYKKEICKMSGFGLKSYKNLIQSIENSKECDLAAFIFALGIPNIGRTTAKNLVEFVKGENQYEKLGEMNFLEVKDLVKMKDCGEVVAKSFVEWFNTQDNRDMVNDFIDLIKFKSNEKEIVQGGVLEGKSVYCTGTFKELKKKDLKVLVEKNGGIFANGYTKSLGYLVVGSVKGSSKTVKAEKDGVKVLTEEEFFKILG